MHPRLPPDSLNCRPCPGTPLMAAFLATHLFEGAEDHLAFVRRVHSKPTRAYGTRRKEREDSGERRGHFGFAAEADGDIPDAALDAIERAQEAIGIETRRRAAFFAESASPTERLRAALEWFDDDQAIRTCSRNCARRSWTNRTARKTVRKGAPFPRSQAQVSVNFDGRSMRW